jgi:hypothetical protein
MTNRCILLLSALLLMFAAVPPVAAQPAPVTFECTLTQIKGIASSLEGSTASTAFVAIPETTVSFVQGGTAPGCIVVRFSGEALVCCSGMLIRAVLDNKFLAHPRKVNFLTEAIGGISGHTFEFLFPRVTPGTHTIQMQYRSEFGDDVFLSRYNTVVNYRP